MPGTWQALTNQPTFSASTSLLLTDGTVMCQEEDGRNWWLLSPDPFGDYGKGTWSPLPAMHHSRLYYASAVLADGRVFVAGGEYSDAGSDTNTAEIFTPPNVDPSHAAPGVWTPLAAPNGWQNIGDAPCCVLPDGRLLLGQIVDTRTAIFDPHATVNPWIEGPNKDDRSSEESWALLSDGTVLTIECASHPKAEKFVSAEDRWLSAGVTPVELVEASSIEIGPGLRLIDGRALFIGATGNTAFYHPPHNPSEPGAWSVGPVFPKINNQTVGAKDAPACLLPNGRVLCTAGPVDGVSGDYLGPTYCFELGDAALIRVPDAPNLGPTSVPYEGRLLMLPNGQVMFTNGTANVQLYVPDGGPDPSWLPQIVNLPLLLRPGYRYSVFGRLLNGHSQTSVYGDDASMATNYPLVRIRNRQSRKVVYCRTADHSTMGIGTGDEIHSTHFTVPTHIEPGPSELCVVANGLASAWARVRVLGA